ncbi:MAG: hypothetical protein WBZ42_00570 [Halobacteriota archaeon]
MDAEKDVAIYRLKSKVYELESENKRYKKNSELARKHEFRITGIIFLIIGAAFSLAAYPSFSYSTMANVLLMVGVGSLFLGGIIVSLNSERFISQNVAKHLNLSSLLVLDVFLRDLRLTYKGLYIPPSKTSGVIKIFIPLEKAYVLPDEALLREDRAFLVGLPSLAQEGVLLEPLGYHLFKYAEKELKAKWEEVRATSNTKDAASEKRSSITPVESILRDTLVDGLELADSVTVSHNDDVLHVRLHDTPYIATCNSIMQEAPHVCRQIGCPLCSLVACIYTDYMDREVTIESVDSVKGDIIIVCSAV